MKTLDDYYDRALNLNLRSDIEERVLQIINDTYCAAYNDGHDEGHKEGWDERGEVPCPDCW